MFCYWVVVVYIVTCVILCSLFAHLGFSLCCYGASVFECRVGCGVPLLGGFGTAVDGVGVALVTSDYWLTCFG